MASPTIAGASTSATTTAGTNHVLNWTTLGTVAAGDLLLVLMNIGSTAATLNAHADYTELLDENLAGGLKILYRWATGGETAPTFVSSASTRDATITYRITGADSGQAPQIGTTAATTNPPALTPTGGPKDFLYIAMVGSTGEQADDGTYVTVFPTNFTHSQQEKTCGVAGTNLGGLVGAAGFQSAASSSVDPSAFTVSEAASRTQTIAIHPSISVSNTLTHVKQNLAFTGGAHSLSVGRALTETKQNLAFGGGIHTLTFHTPNVVLTHIKQNLALGGGTHAMSVGRMLAGVKGNAALAGGASTLSVGRALTTVKANLAFTGIVTTLAVGRLFSTTKGNVSFAGGTHTLTVTGGATHYTLTAIAPNLALLGRSHSLTYSGEPVGEPVRDSQSTLTGVWARARLTNAEANAVLGDA